MFVKNDILREADAGSVAGGAQDSGSLSATIPMQSNAESEGTDVGFSIPDEYKDKTYLKDVTNINDVYKKLDGAQSLIGKPKVNFPNNESSYEDRLAFNISNGMPETAAEYDFAAAEGVDRDLEFDSKIKELFHSVGLPSSSAKAIQEGFENLVSEMNVAEKENADKEFEELSTAAFGDRADDVLANGKQLLHDNLPKELTEDFNKLPNNALIMMASVLDNIKQKYISEDVISDSNSGGGSHSGGIEQLRQKAMTLRNLPGYKDGFHADHEKINQELAELYTSIAKLS